MCLVYPVGVPLCYAYLLLVRFRDVLEEMRSAEQHAIAVQNVVNLQDEPARPSSLRDTGSDARQTGGGKNCPKGAAP